MHILAVGSFLFALSSFGSFLGAIFLPAFHSQTREVVIPERASVFAIAALLSQSQVIKDPLAFVLVARYMGAARGLSSGRYLFSGGHTLREVVETLSNGRGRQDVVRVKIIEGMSNQEIFALLARHGIVIPLELDSAARFEGEFEFLGGGSGQPTAALPARPDVTSGRRGVGGRTLEGFLFPDTYVFEQIAAPREVVARMLSNFETKVLKTFGPELDALTESQLFDIITLASLLEKEIPDFQERQVAADILLKRLQRGIPLQVDATICYIKKNYFPSADCLPITSSDLQKDHPYNTYRRPGLPPGPIANPGITAIRAVLSPQPSPYWYYLSDPQTGRTIFSITKDEHQAAKRKYLAP